TNWLYGFLFVPESLAPEKRKEFSLGRANPVGSLVLLRSHPDLWKLATIQFLAYVSHEIFAIWALYAIYRFGWDAKSIGKSLVVVGVCTAIISVGLTVRVFAWFIYPKHSFQLPAAGYYLAAALLFTAMFMATRIKQPQFTAASTVAPDVPDVVPPEGVTSGTVAPMIGPKENI